MLKRLGEKKSEIDRQRKNKKEIGRLYWRLTN